ncbi:MAG: hypothetical protein LBH65_05090, partial [Desulfovibrio sp.]|nr:hypothetical protein [Desulfovibrio sp.]
MPCDYHDAAGPMPLARRLWPEKHRRQPGGVETLQPVSREPMSAYSDLLGRLAAQPRSWLVTGAAG